MSCEVKYKLYSVPKYSYTKKALEKPTMYTITELVEELENYDSDYYFRIHVGEKYTLFMDIDGLTGSIEGLIEKYINFLHNEYKLNITEEDVCYTKNEGKQGSYHISIPKYHAYCDTIKKIHENFRRTLPEEKARLIDTSIYSEHWFRYPNQSKEGDMTVRHIIVRGNMIDFVQEYIPPSSKEVIIPLQGKSKKKNVPQNNNELLIASLPEVDEEVKIWRQKDKIREKLDKINYEKFILRKEWLHFGTVLKNLNMGWEIFCEYSQKMVNQNHSPCKCESVYTSLSKKLLHPVKSLDDMITINMLINKVPVTMREITDYFNNRVYNSWEDLQEEIRLICSSTIYVFKTGTKQYIAIKMNYSHESNAEMYDFSQYRIFSENYSYCSLYYNQSEDKVSRISLPAAIAISVDLSYDGFFSKPYNSFETSPEYIDKTKKYYNIFSPMIAERMKEYDKSEISIILEHIRLVWAAGDENLYRYILSYFHQIFKTPWLQTRVAMVICGDMGVGKSLILSGLLKHCLGNKTAYQTQGLKSIVAKFQGWLENKLLVICEEPTQLNEMNFSEYTEILKNFITTEVIEIEKKGLEKYETGAYHNLIITCNHLKGITVNSMRDRRYFILECSDRFIGNTEYFEGLKKKLDDKRTMNILFNYLYDLPESECVPLHPIPMTKIKEELIEDSMPVYEKFLFHKQFRCQNLNVDTKLKTDDLYELFILWYDYNKLSSTYKPNRLAFFKEMAKYGKTIRIMVKGDRYHVYQFSLETIERIRKLNE